MTCRGLLRQHEIAIETGKPRRYAELIRFEGLSMIAFLMARKEGLTILALACALTVGWLRSLVVTDEYVTGFVTASQKYTERRLYRSQDGYVGFVRRYRSSSKVTDKPIWSVHYAAVTLPVVLVSARLILRPLRKPMPVVDWIVITIGGIVLLALLVL